ncbi:MAG: class I SAM-dependent methyltransferase [Pseudomonadota bacterium]
MSGTAVINRLRKNQARLKGWLKQTGISCYRIYDADLPEYAAAIDVYQPESDSQPFLHLQEYRAPRSIPEERQAERREELVQALLDVFGVDPERVVRKTRERAKGGSKYGVMDRRGTTFVCREQAARLEVNLWDYLDTGLFLDHRAMRRHIGKTAQGCRVLNLFCYTATASVHAALGGAKQTVSVDLSATYLDWGQRNFALNGLDAGDHRFERSDVLRWLVDSREWFDLIFCDPPTFSNSKSAADFDVQRDHGQLLTLCLDRLAPGGRVLFSNNFSRFRLDTAALEGHAVIEETTQTLRDRDFARNTRIHRSFQLSARGSPG